VNRTKPLWTRGLRLYRDAEGEAGAAVPWPEPDLPAVGFLHAWSRFRSLSDPECFAIYWVRETASAIRPLESPPLVAAEDHTLTVVREFRRVPLDASGLGLMLFTARAGDAARLIATLAHWAERALSTFQPAYLLLAHSLEQPRVSTLLAGVHERRALQWARPSPFSVDLVLPEVGPLLESEPERYVYCPEMTATPALRLVSPHAV
jgi:hypothetical protein